MLGFVEDLVKMEGLGFVGDWVKRGGAMKKWRLGGRVKMRVLKALLPNKFLK